MTQPKILLFDIETAPLVGRAWRRFDTNLAYIDQDWYVLCFGYKWLGKKKVHLVSQTDFGTQGTEDDEAVVRKMHKLFEEADIVIGHNGDQFDIKKMYARMVSLGMPRPEPFKTVDTLKVSRRMFGKGMTSHRLDFLCQKFELGGKIQHTGIDLWIGCTAGDEASWKLMNKYCKQDVALLEKLYLHFRDLGWIPNHPNVATLSARPDICPTCGAPGENLIVRGYRTTQVARKVKYNCKVCNSWSTSRLSERWANSKPDRNSI